MIFSDKIYSKPVAGMILAGEKTQTRRLVKEGECIKVDNLMIKYSPHTGIKEERYNVLGVVKVKEDGSKYWFKWQVGRDYAVQLGRGKAGLWYCPKCKAWLDKSAGKFNFLEAPLIGQKLKTCFENGVFDNKCMKCRDYLKPLRIKLTGIRKERLLDISKKDIKKEGFQTKGEFIKAVQTANKMPKKIKYLGEWNPEVWVLGFCVVKK